MLLLKKLHMITIFSKIEATQGGVELYVNVICNYVYDNEVVMK